MIACVHCGHQWKLESLEDLKISGEQLNALCPSCGKGNWMGFEKLSEELGVSIEEIRNYRDSLKEEEEEQKEAEEEKEEVFMSPQERMVSEMAEKLETELPRVPGVSKNNAKLIVQEYKEDELLQNDDLELYNFIRDICPKANDRMLNRCLDKVFRIRDQYQFGGRRREYLTRRDREGRRRGYQEEYDNLPHELIDLVEKERSKKEAKRMREQLGINELEKQITALTQAVASQGSNANNSDRELIEDAMKMRLLEKMAGDNGVNLFEQQRTPYESIADSLANVGSRAIEGFAPIAHEFVESMGSTQRILSQVVAKDLGIDINRIQGSREAPSFEEVKSQVEEKNEGEG